MSLIHEALKKAEIEKKPQDPNKHFLPNPIIPNKPTGPTRTVVLYVVLALSVLFFIYTRFIKKPAMPQPTAPVPLALKPGENVDTLKKQGLDFFKEGKLDQSLSVWQKLTLLLPTDAEIYNNLGLTLKKMGKKEGAYQAYTKALALQRDYPEALNNLGVLQWSDGDRQKAKSLFQEALQIKSDYADPHLNLAILFEQTGEIHQAQEHYVKFLELTPDLDAALKEKIKKKVDLLGH